MALRVGNRKAFIDRAKTDFKLDAQVNLEKLKSIQTPTLLIWGAKDNWIPLDNGKRMDSIMVNSQLKVLEIQNGGKSERKYMKMIYSLLKLQMN